VTALAADHEQILIALLGAFGIVVAATVPMIWVWVTTRRRVAEVENNVTPTNGDRRSLYEIVSHTDHRVSELQGQVDSLERIVLQHLGKHSEGRMYQ
jgi:hypothetical protein